MLSSSATNDAKIHFARTKTPSAELAKSISEV